MDSAEAQTERRSLLAAQTSSASPRCPHRFNSAYFLNPANKKRLYTTEKNAQEPKFGAWSKGQYNPEG